MQLDEVINNRKTIRKYKNIEIKKEDITEIINSARLAPSAKNRQPWRFYVLNEEQKNRIVTMMYEWDKSNRDIHTSIKGSANQMKEASKVIIIYSPIYKSKNKKTHYKKPDYLSLGAAIENMALKCVDLGMGSCWCCDTLYIEEEINQYLNIPSSDYEQISSFMIGFPAEIPERRERLDLESLIL